MNKASFDPQLDVVKHIVALHTDYQFSHSMDVVDPELKFLWNAFFRFQYGANALIFDSYDLKILLEKSEYEGWPVPHWLIIIDKFMWSNFLHGSHQESPFARVKFEYFLIDYIDYFYRRLFPECTFNEEIINWFFDIADEPCFAIPLPKIIIAYFFSSKLPLDPSLPEDCVRLIGRFYLHHPHFVGNPYFPAEFKRLLDSPSSNVPFAKEIGITVFLETVWEAYPELPPWQIKTSKEDAKKFLRWFVEIKSKELLHYQPPKWADEIWKKNLSSFSFPQPREFIPTAAKIDEKNQYNAQVNDSPAIKPYRKDGVNLIGWPRTEVGIGEDVRMAAESFSSIQFPFSIIDAAIPLPPSVVQRDLGYENFIISEALYDTDITFLDASTQYRYYAHTLLKGQSINRKVIGVCPWELPCWPERLAFIADSIDIFWAATRYIYSAFEPYFPKDKIFLAPPAVVIPEDTVDDFSVEKIEGPFVFLTTFDGISSIDRKNPFAVVRAFKAAFSETNKDVRLIIKTMNFSSTNNALMDLIREIQSDERIELITETLRRPELFSLLKRSHCFVSLHRSEGFGRNIAEAMYFNRPIICSAYSGNLDFCFPDNSYLVEGKEIPVLRGQYSLYQNQHWFDASLEHASTLMKEVYNNRRQAAIKAKKGADYIRTFHSAGETGKRYRKLLQL